MITAIVLAAIVAFTAWGIVCKRRAAAQRKAEQEQRERAHREWLATPEGQAAAKAAAEEYAARQAWLKTEAGQLSRIAAELAYQNEILASRGNCSPFYPYGRGGGLL